MGGAQHSILTAFGRLKCWEGEPEKRPSFKQIGEELQLIWSRLRKDGKEEEDDDGSPSSSQVIESSDSAEKPSSEIWRSMVSRDYEYQLSPIL